jgi:hypothetical protein
MQVTACSPLDTATSLVRSSRFVAPPTIVARALTLLLLHSRCGSRPQRRRRHARLPRRATEAREHLLRACFPKSQGWTSHTIIASALQEDEPTTTCDAVHAAVRLVASCGFVAQHGLLSCQGNLRPSSNPRPPSSCEDTRGIPLRARGSVRVKQLRKCGPPFMLLLDSTPPLRSQTPRELAAKPPPCTRAAVARRSPVGPARSGPAARVGGGARPRRESAVINLLRQARSRRWRDARSAEPVSSRDPSVSVYGWPDSERQDSGVRESMCVERRLSKGNGGRGTRGGERHIGVCFADLASQSVRERRKRDRQTDRQRNFRSPYGFLRAPRSEVRGGG